MQEIDKYAITGDHMVWLLSRECYKSFSDIAAEMGVTRALISNYCKGRSRPSKAKQQLLVKLMRTEIDNLRAFERNFAANVRDDWGNFIVAKQDMLKSMVKRYEKNI